MKSPLQHVYKKNKNRNVLVISAGGETSSIQCLYFTCHNDIWEVISSAIIPYPDRIGRLIENCRNQNITIDEVAWLDYKISLLFVECAKLTLARAPRGARKPHIVALNQLTLYKGPTGENESLPVWNMTIGDPVYCSRSLNAPVISDFIRYDLLSGNSGTAPMHDGNIAIARRFAGTVVLLNIGLISRMTIIDRTAGVTLLDSDTGPGMTLINRCAREINCPDGFDRDGSEAAKGILDITVLDSLATSPWFMKEAPKEAAAGIFDALMQKPALMALAPHDKLAVLTALTARTIHDFYRKNYKQPSVPEIVVVSGGGANNQSLMKYLSTYFGALPLKNCEELGIPVEMRFPLSIGLSVDAFLMGKQGTEIGRVTLP